MPYILIVDDAQDAQTVQTVEDVQNLLRALAQQLQAETTATLALAGEPLTKRPPVLILAELRRPEGCAMEGWRDLPGVAPLEVVLLSGHASLDTALDALRREAAADQRKPREMPRLKGVLARVPGPHARRHDACAGRPPLPPADRCGRMLGASPAMQQVYRALSRVAPSEAAVLLLGESGTGKELAAQTVHELSLRRKGAFVAVNCGAIADNLVESEMFGHERGSFTGAERVHRGVFERAHGGTLFLDEITEMPPESQVKLLRVLETGRLMRVGGTREIEVDVRIVAATNTNPQAAIRDGRFRLDLYHRLNVFPVTLPPLRERRDDIPMLAQAFLGALSDTDGRSMTFSAGSLAALRTYEWPGNVRELRNLVQRVRILSDTDVIDTLPRPVLAEFDATIGHDHGVTVPLDTALEDMDRELILGTLERCGGVKARAAEMLNISVKTLCSRLATAGGRRRRGRRS